MAWKCAKCNAENSSDTTMCVCGFKLTFIESIISRFQSTSGGAFNIECHPDEASSCLGENSPSPAIEGTTLRQHQVIERQPQREDQPSLFPIGIVLLILGVISLVFSLNFDTSVGRYNNIGLLNDKQNYIIISSVLLLAGVVFVSIGYIKNNSAPSTNSAIVDATTTMECPACAEVIKSKAIICRFCGHKLQPPH